MDVGGKLADFQEGLTKYVGVIGSDHAYVHQGKAFTAVLTTGSISAAYDIAFTTPSVASGKYIHWRPIGIDTSADYVSWVLYEGDTFSSGTAVTPVNRNRAGFSHKVSEMQSFVQNATVTPTGTILSRGGVGTSGTPANRSGGGASADEELLLKPNTNYVLTLTPAGATTCNLELFWYEEEGFQP